MEPSRETTVLFAAIVGAGALREKAGDKVAHEALERCQFRLGQAAASCGARLMKSTRGMTTTHSAVIRRKQS